MGENENLRELWSELEAKQRVRLSRSASALQTIKNLEETLNVEKIENIYLKFSLQSLIVTLPYNWGREIDLVGMMIRADEPPDVPKWIKL